MKKFHTVKKKEGVGEETGGKRKIRERNRFGKKSTKKKKRDTREKEVKMSES